MAGRGIGVSVLLELVRPEEMARVVVGLMTTTARDLQLADNTVAAAHHARVQVAGEADKAMTAPPAAKAFAVEEPPADEEALKERRAEVARLLAGFRRHLQDRSEHHLGYPINLDIDLAPLTPFQFQALCINNLGNPFVESNLLISTIQ